MVMGGDRWQRAQGHNLDSTALGLPGCTREGEQKVLREASRLYQGVVGGRKDRANKTCSDWRDGCLGLE